VDLRFVIEERAIWTAAAYLVAKHGVAAPAVGQRFASSNAAHDLDEQHAQWVRVAQAS
jgi:hypothetical protein